MGRSIADFALRGSDFPTPWRDVPENERLTGEFRLQRDPVGTGFAARTVLDVEYAATAHFLPHRHLLVLRDITSRKQIELALHQQNLELELRVEQRTAALQQANEQLRAEIREHQQVEASLRHSQQQLAAITKNIPGAVYRYIYHTDGSVSMPYASEGYFQLLGIEPQELMTHPELALAMIHPSDRERFNQAVRAAKETLEPGYLEYRLISTSGEVKWIRDHARFSRSENGDLIVDGVDIDITDRQQAVDAIALSEQLLRLFADALPVCISYVDANQCYQFVNKTYEVWFGCDREEISGRQIPEVIGEEAYRIVQDQIEQVLAGHSITYEAELPYQGAGKRYISGMLVPDFDHSWRVRGFYALIADISEQRSWFLRDRKQIEVDLVRSQTKLDDILNSAIAAIISFRVFADSTWQYDFFSKGCEAIYGYTVQELMADQSLWKTRVLPEDLEGAILPALEDIFASRSIKVEYRLDHKDGTLRWICGTLTSRRDEAADCWIVTAVDTDITERKQAEEALQESEERFRMLIRELNVGVLLQGRNAEILLSNPKALELLGLTEDQLLGKTSFDPDWQVIHEDGSPFPGSTHPVPVAIATRQPVRNVVMGVRRPKIEGVATGDLVWLLVNAKPQFAPDGNIGHVICTFSGITERKQAEEALRQQAFREHLLGAITANIRQSLNLDEILNTTVAEVRQFLACDRSLIYRLDEKSGVVIVESVSPHCLSILGMQIQDPCLSAKQCIEPYTRGHFQAVADIHSSGLRACYVDSLAQFQVRANLVVPILQGNNLWGLLVAQHCANPRQWQATEIDLLRQLATQVGIAVS